MTLLSSTASTAPSATCATCASAPSLHRLLFLRCSRTSMPALYPRPEKSCGDPDDPVTELNPTGSGDPWAPRPKRSCGSRRLVYSLTFQIWKQQRLWKQKKSRFRDLKSQSHEWTKFSIPKGSKLCASISHHITMSPSKALTDCCHLAWCRHLHSTLDQTANV